MQDPLNFIINSRLGPAAKHTYQWVIEFLDELLETKLCGVMLEQGGPCGHCLGFSISIHILHGEIKFVRLEENEQIHQYGRIPEHSFRCKIYKLFVNIVRQECAKVELGSGLLVGGENGKKSQNRFIYPLIRIVTQQGTQGRDDLVSFSRKHGKMIRGICSEELSGWWEEKLKYLSSLGESHLLV
jgi:hypothetical protein